MNDDDKITIGCTGVSCAFVLLAFAAFVFIIAAAIKWVVA